MVGLLTGGRCNSTGSVDASSAEKRCLHLFVKRGIGHCFSGRDDGAPSIVPTIGGGMAEGGDGQV